MDNRRTKNSKVSKPVNTGGVVGNGSTRFKSGAEWKGNKDGRPAGSKNFATLYREALKKLAELNKTSPEELEIDLVAKGFSKARRGDFRFYKDTLDRLIGMATQKTDITTRGESLNEAGAKSREQLRAIARKVIKEDYAEREG